MKVLITGVAGFIGFHLAENLLNSGKLVVGIDSLNDYYNPKLKFDRIANLHKNKKFEFHAINIINKDEIDQLFYQNKFDLIINLAAQAGVRYSIEKPYKYVDSNLIGFVNILEACRNYNVKNLIFASSSSVYGNSQKTPFIESQDTNTPESLYAATKKANELMAFSYSKLYGIKTIGLRFFTVYGPWGRPDMAYFSFTSDIIKGNPIKVFNQGDMKRDFTYIEDIISGISNLITNLENLEYNYKIYNLGNNTPVQLIDFIKTLEKSIGKEANLDMQPMQPGDVTTTFANIDAAQNDFNYTPKTKIEDGLVLFVNWYRKYFGH